MRNDMTGEVKHHSFGPTDIQEVTVWWKNNKYKILNVYSPPGTTCSLPLLQEPNYTRTIICGDFNGHSPRWGYADLNSTGKYIEKLADTTNLKLVQDENSPATLLHRVHKTCHRPDLTLISADMADTVSSRVTDDMGSDHRGIITKISTPKPAYYKPKTRWNFKKANWKKFKEVTDSLLDVPELPSKMDAANQMFIEAVQKGSHQSIPKGSRKKYKPFWTKEIEKAVIERRTARAQLERSGKAADRKTYNKVSAVVKRTIHKAKQEKWHTTCGKLDLRRQGAKAWSLLGNLSGKKQKVNPKPVETDDSIAVTDKEKAKILNSHFA